MHLHFIDEQTVLLRVLIGWYSHPTVYLVSKPALQTMVLHLRENIVEEERREKMIQGQKDF